MSREIKFRVWTGKDYWHPVTEWGCGGIEKIDLKNRCFVDPSYTGPAYFDDCVVELDTGLNDKNGKEIYEGDIVRVCHNRYDKPNKKGDRQLVEETFNCIVVWDTYKFGFKHQFAELASQIYDWNDFKTHRFHDVTKIEIVGNIHKNPELLDTDKNVGSKSDRERK